MFQSAAVLLSFGQKNGVVSHMVASYDPSVANSPSRKAAAPASIFM